MEQIDQPVYHKCDTKDRVCFFEQEFYVFSNFSSFKIRIDDILFDTSEAAYHYKKFPNSPNIRALIINARSAHEAFEIAQQYKAQRRPDWDDVKINIMRDILREKVKQHFYVFKKLLEVGDRDIIEDSWRDDFWEWGPNKDGQNALGKLWTEIQLEFTMMYKVWSMRRSASSPKLFWEIFLASNRKSTYEIWLEDGNIGTFEDFITYLRE